MQLDCEKLLIPDKKRQFWDIQNCQAQVPFKQKQTLIIKIKNQFNSRPIKLKVQI